MVGSFSWPWPSREISPRVISPPCPPPKSQPPEARQPPMTASIVTLKKTDTKIVRTFYLLLFIVNLKSLFSYYCDHYFEICVIETALYGWRSLRQLERNSKLESLIYLANPIRRITQPHYLIEHSVRFYGRVAMSVAPPSLSVR